MSKGKEIIDQSGRKIVVKQPFKRIISLYGAHTENLLSLGLEQEIIGTACNEADSEAIIKKPCFSYRDDPEKFLSVHPDLVLIRPMIERSYPRLISRLLKSKITVVSIQPGTIDEMLKYWMILGALTGKEKQSQCMVATFKEAKEGFSGLAKDIAVRKKVYFEAIHDKMKTFTKDSMAIFVLETAGGINIAADAKQVRTTNIAFYGKERLLTKAGQVDAYIAQSGTMNKPSISLIKNEPGYQVIKAIQNDQIFIVDEMIVSRPTMGLLYGIYEIGRFLYPEIFCERAAIILDSSKNKMGGCH